LSTLRFLPLGGLGEIGMNCMAIELDGARIVVDCGISFDSRGLGADVLHADLSWLEASPDRLQAIVLTHGHEDHIGAVPYLVRACPVPIFGPPYAIALLRERCLEAQVEIDHLVRPLRPGDRVQAGPFEIEPFRVTHSMPDCTGLILRTPCGVVVHSGDFKIDEDPTDGEKFDLPRLARLREEEGVRLLMSDSTNALAPGSSGGERAVHDRLEALVREAPARVVVSLFASNVHRVRALGEIAERTGRKLVLLGRSLDTHARLSEPLGHLPDLGAVRIPRELSREVARDRLLVLATGTQGEEPAALARLANGTHPELTLEPGDRVIHSARIIPGNEQIVYGIINKLERRGVEVRWAALDPAIHVSGHAHRGEQRTLLETLRPASFLPVHGTHLHLRHHAELARECGVKDTLVAENGSLIELGEQGLRVVAQVPVGRVYRERGVSVSDRVLRDRKVLAQSGVAIVTAIVADDGRPVAPCELLTRGVLSDDEEADLLDAACDEVTDALANARWVEDRPDLDELEDVAARALRRFLLKRTGRRPLCCAIVHRRTA
jgi:ribonuclease J